MSEGEQILHELRQLNKRMARVESAVVLNLEPVAKRAKKLGVSRTTLWRRQKRAKARAVFGSLTPINSKDSA